MNNEQNTPKDFNLDDLKAPVNFEQQGTNKKSLFARQA